MSSIEDVGVAIHVLRVIRDMSQGELAEASGVRNSSISNYERGKSVPKLETVQKLADGLRLPLSTVEETQRFIERVRALIARTTEGLAEMRAGLPESSLPLGEPLPAQAEVEHLSREFGHLASRLVRLVLDRLASVAPATSGGPAGPALGGSEQGPEN